MAVSQSRSSNVLGDTKLSEKIAQYLSADSSNALKLLKMWGAMFRKLRPKNLRFNRFE